MRNRRPLLSGHDGVREVWPAFTDVMSTLALILFVLVLLAYVRDLMASRRLDMLGRQIAASQAQLLSLRADVARERAQLVVSQAALREQQDRAARSNGQLDLLRSQLQSIAVLRVEVLRKLEQALQAELGPGSDAGETLVSIGDNGNVLINESLVFEYNSYAIKKEGQPLLQTLARALGSVLSDPDVRANVDTILIQGHADRRGSASFNWDLSAKRATAVLDYMFRANPKLADSYGSYFAAAAYSMFRPIDPADTEDAYQRNRRIEIAIIVKDSNVRKVIDDYTQSIHPAPQPAPAGP